MHMLCTYGWQKGVTIQAEPGFTQHKLTGRGGDGWEQFGSAKLLKDEGNRFFTAKAYDQAADKYTRAKSSLAGAAQEPEHLAF